jgi:hypothetical protein
MSPYTLSFSLQMKGFVEARFFLALHSLSCGMYPFLRKQEYVAQGKSLCSKPLTWQTPYLFSSSSAPPLRSYFMDELCYRTALVMPGKF